MKYIPCFKCNFNGLTSNVCRCDENLPEDEDYWKPVEEVDPEPEEEE